ncbi:MAG: 50S ribosomal protein L29 [Gemmatimonadota bacterium]|nr:50S ribosomal protein L29 [Gemmatimonadota bacterium]MDH5195797.1 50S ribosomal protein L29 [Gemmatimonadota bacterium]
MALNAEQKALDMTALRELSVDELRTQLTTLREAQFRLRFRAATEDISADNPMRFRTMRRNIARIETVLRERTRA